MSTFHAPHTGALTSRAAHANLSLSGLDDFAPTDEPDMMDPQWYHGQDHFHHGHVQPALSPVDELSVSTTFAFPAHTAAAAFADASFPLVDVPMNASPYPYQNGAPRLDDLSALSPLSPVQSHFNPNSFQNPYPASTTSSAPSDDPLVADAEEDKRKRNQAASARFRQKKKQREAQMLELSREASEKNKKLEAELETLKRENTFLRKLLVEKVDNMNETDRELLVKTANEAKKAKN